MPTSTSQVSLLAEHEVTRLITVVKHIAERLDLDVTRQPDLHELEQDVAPETVLDALAENQRRINSHKYPAGSGDQPARRR